jgi:hypothetical protein
MVALPKPTGPTTIAKFDLALEAENAKERPFRGHLGCSIIGRECDRQLWYAFRGVQPSSFPGRILRLFERGHREEPSLVKWLELAGVTVHETDPNTGRQFNYTAHGGHFAGSMDGAGVGFVEAPKSWHVIEFKTSAEKPFRQMQKNGVEKSKPEHFAQMQLYMHLSGMRRAYYLMVNKNNDELYSERLRYDESAAIGFLEKGRRIVTSPTPLSKISNSPAFYRCKWCDDMDVCHGDALPLAHCRTCAHSTPEMDGAARWSCRLLAKDLTMEEQATGCAAHLYIPALLTAVGTPINADTMENWVEYEPSNGGKNFRNGCRDWETGAGFSSEQIREHGANLQDKIDPTLAALVKTFDGADEFAWYAGRRFQV